MTAKKNDNMALYLFHQGTNFHAYDYLGVHKTETGYVFRVWAPHAKEIFVVGDFNGWMDTNPMTCISEEGVWEATIDGSMFGEGTKYKFLVRSQSGDVYKADPYAFYAEKAPATASVYYDISGYSWSDKKWLDSRKKKMIEPKYETPVNIYELHVGSWKRHADGTQLSYRELAHELAPYVKQMGYTHVELMPIAEYPFEGSWGYQVCGYYAPTSRFGDPHDFMFFIDYMHQSGIGVILDWVPAHFPKDEHGLYEFDGGPLYEYQGKDRMENRGWGTRCFDVGRTEVESFLISNAMFWLREYHVDGLRVDAVASMLYLDYDKKPGEWFPNAYGGKECLEAVAFFRKLGDVIRSEYPDSLFIAEESTSWAKVSKPASEDGLGFNFKWNMGWMNDSLDYFSTDPLFRKYKHDKLTFSMMYAFSENYILPISHDEVVHGKKSLLDRMPGEYEKKFAGLRAFLAYMMTHPGKKLLFMGCEIGQFTEWNYKDSVEWFLLDYDMHAATQRYVASLNHFYLEHDELWQNDYSWDGFTWIECDNKDESLISYVRRNNKGKELIVVLNFTPVARPCYPIGVKNAGVYTELFNSDDKSFGGSGALNEGLLKAEKEKRGDYNYVIRPNIPPFGALILKRTRSTAKPDKTEKVENTDKAAKKSSVKSAKKKAK